MTQDQSGAVTALARVDILGAHPGTSIDIGFQATHTGNTAEPTAFTLDGIPCTVI
ncbi:hypothetical protein [Streptosporangium sp. NPDC048865]|uniref:hypothetical protein n=1 Tax=Streptosporangium sp. NPDC048865 TaxID=3155766 RepID=UPI0034184916